MRKIDYLLFLQNIRAASNGFLNGFFLTITQLAESPIPYLFLAWIYWCKDKRIGQIMALNTGISCAVNQALKAIVRIPRPWLRDERIIPVQEAIPAAGGDSFPSGHTVRAGCAYGSYGIECIRKKEKATGIMFLLLILLLGFSRNWLGVHTLEDVLVGILIFISGHFLIDKALKWTEKGGIRDIVVCLFACILICLPMIWLGWLSNCGSCLGFFLGWLFEKRFVQFKTPEDNSQKMKRVIPGFLGILLITTAYQSIIRTLLTNSAVFCSNFFLSFFIMALYPAIYALTSKTKRSIAVIFTAFIFLLPVGISLAKAENLGEIAVIGHRGFAAAAPENTMPAFEKAVKQNVDYIELDVQLSADRQIVVCHDSNLKHTAGVDISLSALTLEEIKRLDVGAWFSEEYAGTTMPTLAEVLELIKGTDIKIYLELKDIGEDGQFPLKVYQLTREYQMENQCVYASFQYEYLKTIKKAYPDAKILLNTSISEITLPDKYPSDYCRSCTGYTQHRSNCLCLDCR